MLEKSLGRNISRAICLFCPDGDCCELDLPPLPHFNPNAVKGRCVTYVIPYPMKAHFAKWMRFVLIRRRIFVEGECP